LDKSLDDSSVDLEKIITSHTGLAYMNSESAQCIMMNIWLQCNNMYSRGIPAGMTTTLAPVRAFFRPSSLGR
jgi:hypothetical protein